MCFSSNTSQTLSRLDGGGYGGGGYNQGGGGGYGQGGWQGGGGGGYGKTILRFANRHFLIPCLL